jgi:STE24 endopeptidase
VSQQRAKEYNRKKVLIEIEETMLLIAFLALFMTCGWSVSLKEFLSHFTSSFWILNGLYSLMFFLLIKIVSFPLDYYSGYMLEHTYQLSTESFSSWITDELKGLVVSLLFSLIIVEIVYGMIHVSPALWWLITALVLNIIIIIMIKLAPLILMPIFFKFRQVSDPDLRERIMRLTEKVHTRINGIFEMNLSKKSKSANAALAGLGRTRRIILSDTLLKDYSHDEIEVIMAHELGHHVYHHLWKGIFIQSTMVLFLLFVISRSMNKGLGWFQLSGIDDIAGLPYLTFISILFSLIFLPLTNLYLRHLEYQADQYGVEVTGKRAVFIQALEKLALQNLSDREPNPIIEFIFYSHPSIGKRTNRLLTYGQDHTT